MSVSYPNQYRNYCIFDIKEQKTLPEIKASLENPKSEEDILESLYTLNLILDKEGVNEKGVNKDVLSMYPLLSKYNNTSSPNIQTFLAGIYRKTKIPDAFGPLFSMLIRNSINPPKDCGFDPNEEIGGAILDYLA